MARKSKQPSEEQLERAKRLREDVERLKRGGPAEPEPGAGESLKEQIEKRAAEQEEAEP
jgi:hypothetical protein